MISVPPNTNEILAKRDLKHIWHPCSQMKDYETFPPIPIKRGFGVWLEDFHGKRYLDAISSWWVNLFGHCHPEITRAVKNQLDQLEHVLLAGFSHEPIVQLSEQLTTILPSGLSRLFYADNGSAAVEIALKMSFHYWQNRGLSQKTRFVSLGNSYHGETLGALAISDVPLYRKIYHPLLLPSFTAPSPDCFSRETGETWKSHTMRQFSAMQTLLEKHSENICAVIIEPLVQCAGNMRMYHFCYLSELRRVCDRLNVHLIADEVAVGFGRTGTMFACEQGSITPDFLCLGKGLSGGYLPLSVVATQEKIYQEFYDDYNTRKAFLHSHSYSGNPLACSAALATLNQFKKTPVIANNRVLAQKMHQSIAHLQDHPHVAEIRQCGMILAIELVKDKKSKTPYPAETRIGLAIQKQALARGVLLRPLGSVIYFMPPYVINDDEIAKIAEVTTAAIMLVTQEHSV